MFALNFFSKEISINFINTVKVNSFVVFYSCTNNNGNGNGSNDYNQYSPSVIHPDNESEIDGNYVSEDSVIDHESDFAREVMTGSTMKKTLNKLNLDIPLPRLEKGMYGITPTQLEKYREHVKNKPRKYTFNYPMLL